MQSRISSLLEAKANTVSGFFLSWFTMAVIVPIIWPSTNIDANNSLGIVLVFTGISVGRNYVVRRFFNWRDSRPITK